MNGVFLEDAVFSEFHSAVESSLASESEKNTLRSLFCKYLFNEFFPDRDGIDFVRELLVGMDRCDVRVHNDSLDSFFAESLDRLGGRVVEFACFAYLYGTAADDDDLVEPFDLHPFTDSLTNWSKRN